MKSEQPGTSTNFEYEKKHFKLNIISQERHLPLYMHTYTNTKDGMEKRRVGLDRPAQDNKLFIRVHGRH